MTRFFCAAPLLILLAACGTKADLPDSSQYIWIGSADEEYRAVLDMYHREDFEGLADRFEIYIERHRQDVARQVMQRDGGLVAFFFLEAAAYTDRKQLAEEILEEAGNARLPDDTQSGLERLGHLARKDWRAYRDMTRCVLRNKDCRECRREVLRNVTDRELLKSYCRAFCD